MNLLYWSLLFSASSLIALWILRWGGAEWMEGWKSLLFIDWLGASSWHADQIKLYFLLLWLLHAGWFVIGLFVPGARGA